MSDKIIENVDALKELNSRAQGEVSIRDALTELEVYLICKAQEYLLCNNLQVML